MQAVALLAAALVGFGRPARAQEPEPRGDDVDRAIERVLASEDFGARREVESWRFDWNRESETTKHVPEDESDESKLPQFGLDFIGVLATLFEVVLWTAIIGLFVFLAVVIAKRIGWLDFAKRAQRGEPERPTHVFGLDVRPESLPADVPAAARALWARGDTVAALALLYRAAISRLVERDGLEVAASDTEGDCLRRARKLPDAARADYFAGLTRDWQKCAYSRARPAEDEFERLCSDWTLRFERVTA
jgi:hypothetical protein